MRDERAGRRQRAIDEGGPRPPTNYRANGRRRVRTNSYIRSLHTFFFSDTLSILPVRMMCNAPAATQARPIRSIIRAPVNVDVPMPLSRHVSATSLPRGPFHGKTRDWGPSPPPPLLTPTTAVAICSPILTTRFRALLGRGWLPLPLIFKYRYCCSLRGSVALARTFRAPLRRSRAGAARDHAFPLMYTPPPPGLRQKPGPKLPRTTRLLGHTNASI